MLEMLSEFVTIFSQKVRIPELPVLQVEETGSTTSILEM
jgi:hypothetical protein